MQFFDWYYILLFSALSYIIFLTIELCIYGTEIQVAKETLGFTAETEDAKRIIRNYKIIYIGIVPLIAVAIGNLLANYVYFSTESTRMIQERQIMAIGAYFSSILIPLMMIKSKHVTQDYIIPLARWGLKKAR